MADTMTGSYTNAAPVNPDDSADLQNPAQALHVGKAGNLMVNMAGKGTVIFRGVQPGILPIRVTRVFSTGTTAGDIVCLW